MIAVVDYGLGNVRAFQNVYERLNLQVSIVSSRGDLMKADRIIVPGVGAFDDAMSRLERSGMRPALEECVLERRVPVLGVCVGMQMLGDTSEEGCLGGLGWVHGRVKRLPAGSPGPSMCVPHMGWDEVSTVREDGLFAGLTLGARFYFLHSYYFEAESEDSIIAVTKYGQDFACAIRAANVYGVQFHPEKSHAWGVRLLENFARVAG
ncbi:MAG: imidazole glycerol phosphate synthase subunit HisH [Actinomycetota bacterium]|nr:imidazole glycerol phosphate synthase subunit HisH [Actinomycetota bacterium]